MSSLEALGKLEKVKTFKKKLDISIINKTKLGNPSELKMAEATLNVALEKGKIELAKQLEIQILEYETSIIIDKLLNNYDAIKDNPKIKVLSEKIVTDNIKNNTKKTTKLLLKIIIKKIKLKILRKN